MIDDLNTTLLEIEEIIAKIGNHDMSKGQFSEQGRNELNELFNKKIQIAKSLNEKLKLVS